FLHSVFLLFGVSVLTFLFTTLAPGNYFDEMRLNPQIAPETVTALRARYELDRPLPVRYLRWVASVARGEMGFSFAYNSPVAALVLSAIPLFIRHVRAAVAEVLETGFMRAAQGQGIPRRRLLYRYALPAAANPLISLFGFSLGALLSGSLLVEVVMSWPGLGPLLLEAILARDLYVVIGGVLLSTLFLVGGNFVADLLLYWADPRIRTE